MAKKQPSFACRGVAKLTNMLPMLREKHFFVVLPRLHKNYIFEIALTPAVKIAFSMGVKVAVAAVPSFYIKMSL